MGHSNEGFAGATSPWAEHIDASRPLPEPGVNEPLDSLCERRHISIGDLVRVGARLHPDEDHVLLYIYPDAIKARDLITGKEWNLYGANGHRSNYDEPKVIAGSKDRTKLVVVEGETDAARMSGADGPGYDVLVQAGAEHLHDPYVTVAQAYEAVFIGLDADDAGDRGAKKWERALGEKAKRWRPPAKDWCAVDGKLPAPPEPPKPPPLLVWGDDLFGLEYPEVPSYFENALLPKTGMLVIHGWKNSYKSWLGFDMAVALATGRRWAKFDAMEDDVRVLIMQFEVPPFGYRDRMLTIRNSMPKDDWPKFKNIAHYSPLQLQSPNVQQEAWREHVLEIVDEAGADVVYFDPIRQMVGTSSLNEQEVQQHLTQLFRELNRMGKAVIFVHHDSKTGARRGGGSLLDMTAGDVLVGAADSAVSVQLPKGEDLEESRRRNLRYVIRSGQPTTPSGFTMADDMLVYHEEAWLPGDEDEDEMPDRPSIG